MFNSIISAINKTSLFSLISEGSVFSSCSSHRLCLLGTLLLFEDHPLNSMEQGFLLPDFTLPSNWMNHPQTKCYPNLDTGDVFCYSEDMLCFVDAPPNQSPLNDWKTKIKMEDQSFATEDSSDSSMKTTAGMEITSTKGKTKMEIGENLSASEESSMETTLAMNTASKNVKAKMEMEDESSASEDSSDTYEEEPYAMETCPEKVENRIVMKRRCGTCGGLGHNRRTCS